MEKLIHLTDLANLPLSSNQKRLWIISKQDKCNPAYNILLSYHLEGDINKDIFKKSIDVLFDRQHTMFSVFRQRDGSPYIEIVPTPVVIEFIDFSGCSIQSKKEEIISFAGEHLRECFNIEKDHLYRLFLIKEDEKSYFFFAVVHHLIFDGFSRRIFVKELSSIYTSLVKGVDPELDPIKFHSYDFAAFEKNARPLVSENDQLEFWKENLKDCQPELKFPYDYPRSSYPGGSGCREPFTITKENSIKLRKLSSTTGTSLFNTLLSAIGVLFQKYTGENDICIGVPISDRRSNASFKIFGLFVKTIVVRLLIDGRNKFRENLAYTTEVLKKAVLNSELPFEKIVEAINPERVAGANPLFQISFSWMNNSAKPMDLGGISGKTITPAKGVSPFDITFYMWENDGLIEGEIEYNTDLLRRETIIRLRDSFLILLQNLTDNPDLVIEKISVASESDKKKLSEFNNTGAPISGKLIQNAFENQAILNPLKTAVTSGSSHIKYRYLDDKSNQLANYLISMGVAGGDIVGICHERSLDMVSSILGILKAGCCYLPIDPTFPDDRISYMIEDSGARILITQSSLKDKFGKFAGTSVIMTDRHFTEFAKLSAVKPDLKISDQELAYIMYTSGSTGKPKGVKVHHQAVVSFLNSMTRKPGFSSEERLLAVTTLSFDISVLEFFLPLSLGAQLVIADTYDMADGNKLSALINLNDITFMQATPSTWNILLDSGWNGKENLKALCGGEAIPPGLVKDLLPRVESLWDMYGPTETTVWSTCNQLTDSESPILVGKPIENTTIYILDNNNNLVPLGVIGEVCIGGAGVSKGYNKLPELTAERFITFGDGQILYKTGDLGRIHPDGNLEIFGRIDNQIKMRGFRIETAEIEGQLTRYPDIKEAVVKVHKFDKTDERLVAFLNVGSEFRFKKEELIRFLSKLLPGYMIPSFFQIYNGFPKLPNGKINKKELVFEIVRTDNGENSVFDLKTLTPIEKVIYEIWCEALKTRDISITDNFFDIGGNSLLAISVFSKIESAFNVDLGLRIFFDSPVIKNIAETIDITINKIESKIAYNNKSVTDSEIINGEI